MQYVERIRLNLDDALADKCSLIMDGRGDAALTEHEERLSDPNYFDMIDYIAIERSIIYYSATQASASILASSQRTILSQNAIITEQLLTIAQLQNQVLGLQANYDDLIDDYNDQLNDNSTGFVQDILSDRATQFALSWDINNAVGKRFGEILSGS
jgi:hypothetical protein